MKEAPIPDNEKERLAALLSTKILKTPPEERFDRITRIAADHFDVPISTVTLVGSNEEWYKSCQGLRSDGADRAISFCGHTINFIKPLVVNDTLKDPWFKDNPLVLKGPKIRFYAGIPIIGTEGYAIGAFCIKDKKPRKLSAKDLRALEGFAAWAELEINAADISRALVQTKFELWKAKK